MRNEDEGPAPGNANQYQRYRDFDRAMFNGALQAFARQREDLRNVSTCGKAENGWSKTYH